MSDLESSNWNEAAANNNAATPNGWPEGQAPSSVNYCAREVMGAVKRDWNRSHTTIASTGSANAYVLTYTTAPAAYVNGQQFAFSANFANTGSATASVNGLVAVTIQKQTSAGMANLASGDIQSGQHVILEYDSSLTKLILLNPQAATSITTPVTVANGGTGLGTLTAHNVMLGEGTSNVAFAAPGAAGTILTSAGASSDPTFANQAPVTTKTADYTLVQADQGGTFVMNSASTHTFTLPSDATVGNGWSVRIINRGAGVCTIARAGSDTIASGGSTALTSISLSQDDSGIITADGQTNGIFWWIGSRHYDSGQQTITSGGGLTLAHGLGVQPHVLMPWLHNVTAEQNYSIGDEIPIWAMGENGANQGAAYITDATNVNVRFGTSAGNAFNILNKTTGAVAGITNADWKLVVRAWVYN